VWSEEPVRLPGYRPDHTASVDDLDRAAEMIAQAKRPIILAGHGILRAEASQLLLEFRGEDGRPCRDHLLGIGGFPATHPFCLGMMGMHGEAW